MRLQANQIMNLQPGEVFVQRNVGNQALHTDMNAMSCLEYAVKSLKVRTRQQAPHACAQGTANKSHRQPSGRRRRRQLALPPPDPSWATPALATFS